MSNYIYAEFYDMWIASENVKEADDLLCGHLQDLVL